MTRKRDKRFNGIGHTIIVGKISSGKSATMSKFLMPATSVIQIIETPEIPFSVDKDDEVKD